MKKLILLCLVIPVIITYYGCASKSPSNPGSASTNTVTQTKTPADTSTITRTATPTLTRTVSPTATITKVVRILYSTAAEDGEVTSDGHIYQSLGLRVGDDAGNTAYQALLSFDITSLPAGTIEAVALKVHSNYIEAGAYGLGSVRVTHLPSGYTPFGIEDYNNPNGNVPAGETLLGPISTEAALGFHELNTVYDSGLITAINSDISATRPRSQFRLFRPIATDSDSVSDLEYFDSTEQSDVSYRPVLIITYQ